ncbi:haloacid dehalogenase [Nostoc linckia z18]|uniref:Haloacid dehalogenase n=2 Tax=Nostoc linckia TaxID=92942 RepID=A0A9Q5Z5K8_NOSLI|nr:HAD family hydrolase [Nostoc linckia]PHK33450.1 haloacid dehalogenase [Nostoc linckia z15]PHK39438.1 haloacid dehalogenase [Nostoc linckia z16]PHJ55742.1 haloacid dehalogenase [Nostoc linckia z1]PHJ59337.1 haloacid dehalogenase [Nostoc linckia z2]PHJ63148.1 haloacid dehalogenase [Nostoc linckia z3]
MLRLITDFDGPIIDVSERYYRVYQFCLEKTRRPEQTVNELPKAEFWEFKRRRVPEKQIALNSGLDEAQAQEFAQLRRQTVHTQPYFEYDTLAPGAVDALLKIQQAGIDLAVMTMRRVKELDYAFKKYDLDRFFPENRCYCLSNDYVKTRDIEDKPLLMARAIEELPAAADTWMVGDTEADITAAKKHDIKAIAVECGIRDRTQLELYHPDLIVKDLSAAVNLILESKSFT